MIPVLVEDRIQKSKSIRKKELKVINRPKVDEKKLKSLASVLVRFMLLMQ